MSCYKCEKRALGCHSSCEEYKSFREEKDKQKEKMRAQSITSGYEVDRQKKSLAKQAKKILREGKDRRR